MWTGPRPPEVDHERLPTVNQPRDARVRAACRCRWTDGARRTDARVGSWRGAVMAFAPPGASRSTSDRVNKALSLGCAPVAVTITRPMPRPVAQEIWYRPGMRRDDARALAPDQQPAGQLRADRARVLLRAAPSERAAITTGPAQMHRLRRCALAEDRRPIVFVGQRNGQPSPAATGGCVRRDVGSLDLWGHVGTQVQR